MKAPILGQGVVGAAGKEGRAGREGWERGRGACGPAPPHPAHGPSPEPWKIPRDLALREEPSQAQMLSGTVQVPPGPPLASRRRPGAASARSGPFSLDAALGVPCWNSDKCSCFWLLPLFQAGSGHTVCDSGTPAAVSRTAPPQAGQLLPLQAQDGWRTVTTLSSSSFICLSC